MKTKKLAKKIGRLLAYVAAFLMFSLVMDYWRGQNLPKEAIPHAELIDITGQPFLLEQISQQQLAVVYFWATWCGPCKVSTPSLERLSKSFPVVSIALQSGEDTELMQYINKNTLTLPVVNDAERQIANEWGVAVTPTVLFIRHGEVVGYTSGVSFYPGLWLRAWWLETFG